MLDRYPLLSRLSLILACLASLSAALFVSAGVAARLESLALAQPDGDAAARLAGVGLIQVVLMFLFVAGCGLILRTAWKVLAVRTDLALAA